VRRSRRRFWKSEQDADKGAAYATLYEVLLTLARLLAPMVPFVTEVMYQNLARGVDPDACESVHHCDWPLVDEAAVDQELLDSMSLATQIAALGRSARSGSNVKLRQPWHGRWSTPGRGRHAAGGLVELVSDELNVKEIEFVAEEADLVRYEIGLLPNILGKKHGRRFPRAPPGGGRPGCRQAGAALPGRRQRRGGRWATGSRPLSCCPTRSKCASTAAKAMLWPRSGAWWWPSTSR
jgi:isoleucyl-tRNA synthetase